MSQNITVSRNNKIVNATIQLTGSKSECNRALVIEALSKGKVNVTNISDAADAVTLAGILRGAGLEVQSAGTSATDYTTSISNPHNPDPTPLLPATEVNIGPAGTAMRFLTAYFSLQDGEVLLTGTERMKQRPIGILVDALRQLGADISYAENEDYPPLHIKGGFEQLTDSITIKGDISSQYITALLLIASSLPKGLQLHIDGELTSRPYVEMTLSMLQQAGIQHQWAYNVISIAPQEFRETNIWVEPDWSAASYWYAVAALADEAELFLPGLTSYSLQGDSVITELMANFGITSQFRDGGVHLKKEPKPVIRKIFDLKSCPDLAQTLIVVCAALGHEATFTGLETLKIKETDRIAALQNELIKMGVRLTEKGLVYKLDCSHKFIPKHITIKTYEDHRMAMAFAPLAMVLPQVEIEEADVVNKSYPAFWQDFEKAGFSLQQ